MSKPVQWYTANVFLPGCLGPVRRDVVLEDDYYRDMQALESRLHEVATHCATVEQERDALAAENKRLREALTIVSNWNLPATGEYWSSGGDMSYEACYGSNGVRDYMRRIAQAALQPNPGQMEQPQ